MAPYGEINGLSAKEVKDINLKASRTHVICKNRVFLHDPATYLASLGWEVNKPTLKNFQREEKEVKKKK